MAAALLAFAGCGGDDETTGRVPAANDVADPGAPPEGEPVYAGLGTWWTKQPDDERVASAEDFIADNPAECDGVAARDLERQTGIAYGYDFPEATDVASVMLETCALIRDGE